jgi:hypothetical protein
VTKDAETQKTQRTQRERSSLERRHPACVARRRRARGWSCGSLLPPLLPLLPLLFVTLAAGGSPRSSLPTYTCYHTTGPVTIDGHLDEQAWQAAPVVRDFRLPDGVSRPSVATEFRALWDDGNLYLAFVCTDPEIIATMTERDSGLYDEDCVEAFISSGDELRRYYEFELSPRNVQMDASVFPTEDGKDKVVDYSWNCVGLRTATSITEDGWIIEVAIPFGQIGRDKRTPHAGDTWRANFYRADYSHGRETEYICWSPMMEKEANFHRPDRFGRLVFAAEPVAHPAAK